MRTAIDKNVAFVTLGGDTFDGRNPSIRARVNFGTGIEALHRAGIPVYMTLGNHDSVRDFPDSTASIPGLHVFGPGPERKELEAPCGSWRVHIHGASFEQPGVRENLVQRFARDAGADIAIGVVHTNVAGMQGHDDYAPCTLGDLRASGMDVWCLGHAHTPTVVSENPLVVYSGTAQGAHPNETGPKGCQLITVNGRDQASAEFVPIAPVLWERVKLDCSEAFNDEQVLDAMEEACRDLEFPEDNVEAAVVSIEIRGTGAMSVMASQEGMEVLLEILSERLASYPVPLVPAGIKATALQPRGWDSRSYDEEGFVGDVLRLCRAAATDQHLAEELIHPIEAELVKKINSRFIQPAGRPRSLLEDPERLAERMAEVERFLVRAFMDRA